MTKLEVKLFSFRNYRKTCFVAFDLWEKAVLRGREQDDASVVSWYQSMKNFPSLITENTTFDNYPVMPAAIKKYL